MKEIATFPVKKSYKLLFQKHMSIIVISTIKKPTSLHETAIKHNGNPTGYENVA